MGIATILEQASREAWTDAEVVERVRAGETALYEIVMRRYNQRLYRTALAILRDSAEAEDVMQDTYVRAFRHLDQFRGSAKFSTWLTRIAVNEALHRIRLRGRTQPMDFAEDDGESSMNLAETSPNPEEQASIAELGGFLERAVLELPDPYRTVVMLRDIEELSTAETAAALNLTEENVKVRLHRGRAMARNWLIERVGAKAETAFPFMGARCDRVVRNVFAQIADLDLAQSSGL